MIGKLLEYSFVMCAFIGGYFIAKKDIRGFYVCLMDDIIAVPFAGYYHHWAFLVLNIGYTALNLYAIYEWKRIGKKEDNLCLLR